MSRRSVSCAAAFVLLAASPSPALSAAGNTGGHGPTPAQIRAAIAKVKRSPDLWATVNICNTQRYPDTLGIRAQMPALGFRSALSIDIRVEYQAGNQFLPVPDPHARKRLALGRFALRVHQDGWTFQFPPGSGVFRGAVTFQWKLHGKVIGRVTRSTTGRHKHVDAADPRGHSAATCLIP